MKFVGEKIARFCTPRTRLHANMEKKKKKRKEQKEENWRELRDFYRCNNFHEMDDSSVSNFR